MILVVLDIPLKKKSMKRHIHFANNYIKNRYERTKGKCIRNKRDKTSQTLPMSPAFKHNSPFLISQQAKPSSILNAGKTE